MLLIVFLIAGVAAVHPLPLSTGISEQRLRGGDVSCGDKGGFGESFGQAQHQPAAGHWAAWHHQRLWEVRQPLQEDDHQCSCWLHSGTLLKMFLLHRLIESLHSHKLPYFFLLLVRWCWVRLRNIVAAISLSTSPFLMCSSGTCAKVWIHPTFANLFLTALKSL